MYLNDNVEIRAGWASVYGLDPETGRPNYDGNTEGLLIELISKYAKRSQLAD
jgi:hypothetical protein